MADDTRIPSAFRDALDEPSPPAPPTIEPERGDGGDGGHHIHFIHPVVMLLSNGAVQTTGWHGSLLVGWWHLASFVTIALALWAAVQWFPLTSAWMLTLFALAAGAGVGTLILYDLIARSWRWARR